MDATSSYTSQPDILRSVYTQASGAAAFKLDEGFSEDPRGQDDADLAATTENTSGFEEWVMAQSEDARAGEFCDDYCFVMKPQTSASGLFWY